MILAIDVHYRADFAKVVAIAFENWKDQEPKSIHELFTKDFGEYIPGQFYKRELPCILKILEKVSKEEIELIIIDGFVILDDEGKAGLGKHLYDSLNHDIPIIGVAKRGFINNEKNVVQIKRGESENPLFITSIGIDLNLAAEKVKNMFGDYRMPELLKILDQHTKKKNHPNEQEN